MLMQIHFHAMGCQMMAALDAAVPHDAELLQQVPRWFEGWEQHLSRFRVDSEVTALNRSDGQAFPVSQVVWEVFQVALQAERRSQGWVTPTIYDALVQTGYVHSFSSGVSAVESLTEATPRPAPPLGAIGVDAERQTLTLPPNVHLDFGGVAKGWAADQVLHRLNRAGPAIIDAGGDVAVGDLPVEGGLWPVAIGDPFGESEPRDLLMLSNCGVATSGRDYRRWQANGAWQHHLIDPHTGQPAQTDVISATVVAPTVVEAELAAKVVLLAGSRAGMDWLDAQDGWEGVAVLEDNRRVYSRHLKDFLWSEE